MAEPGERPEQARTLKVLVLGQLLSGAGLAAGLTVGVLIADEMLGGAGLAGVSMALFILGAAGASAMVGGVSQRRGRRVGLALGYLLGAVGAFGVVVAAGTDSIALLLVSFVVYGAGSAANLQARYAGADLATPATRGRAVSTVLVATTLGAVAGPNLVTPTGAVARAMGLPELAGPFLLAGVAYGAAGLVLLALLRPDPLLLARRLAHQTSAAATDTGSSPDAAEPVRRDVLLAGVALMTVTQVVMIAIMTVTPLHMRGHGHSLGAAGLVIAVHVGAMYLPAPLAGWLLDRFGAALVTGAAAGTLLAAGVVAALAPVHSVPVLALALGLLGVGWSLGLVGGTAMVASALPVATRARTQGVVDLLIALAGAGSGLGAGFVVAGAGFTPLALGGGLLALLLVPVVVVTAKTGTTRTGTTRTGAA
ncbi:MFS transporter [Cellulomonas bogoriensis 69B4 = DSM 16987]|uniref:MFS transporter n=1 Tax=Cellulomonas bogoriensis 69B4 = DSM 16987 TaxID=1386082 RepID=A0A0A0BTZ6_9CELL|nr:MFS transporter [Cellulomonas bogoriensis 69B4 = DSM 16987]